MADGDVSSSDQIRPSLSLFLAVLPCVLIFCLFESREALILCGLHVFVVAYFVDYRHLLSRPSEADGNLPAAPVHVFLVAWFLPFVLTVAPSMQMHHNPYFIEAIVKAKRLELFSDPKLQDDLAMILSLAATPLMARATLFGSLVVLVPLELFALFYLQDLDKRHTLIAAGCLDIAMLFFLLLVASDGDIVMVTTPVTRYLLIFYFIILWAASLLSSFQAIWASQYRDHLSQQKVLEARALVSAGENDVEVA